MYGTGAALMVAFNTLFSVLVKKNFCRPKFYIATGDLSRAYAGFFWWGINFIQTLFFFF